MLNGCRDLSSKMVSSNPKLLRKAFRIIRRNYGCPGNDGISITDIRRDYNHFKLKQIQQLESGDFDFELHPKKVKINDYLGKEREVYVYSVPERWTQEVLRLLVAPFVEGALTASVFAHRRNMRDIDSYVHILISNPKYILKTDIEDFFSHINKEVIFGKLKELSVPSDQIYAVQRSLQHCAIGLPPGNVLSCMLSNLSLADFDGLFTQDYSRYGDDMMFACRSEEEVQERLECVTEELGKRCFPINMSKIQIMINPTIKDFYER